MSSNSRRRPGKKDPSAAKADPGSANRRQDTGYEVGYGKPPKHSRFVNGKSGNPRGRPRKPKPRRPRLSDALSDGFLEEEAYRTILLRENGKAIKLPATQAVLRALVTDGIKGKRLSQKYFLEHVARMEELHFQQKMGLFHQLQALKRDGERTLADHERKGLPPPDLVPHPDDIVLHPTTGEATVNGPETPEDVAYYEHTVRLRDHLLLRSVHASQHRRKTTGKAENDGPCFYLIIAGFLDRSLPHRYRWEDDADLFLMMDYELMPKRDRERRIAAELDQLEATRSKLSSITPEMKSEIDRIVRKWFKRPGASPDERTGMHGDG